MSWLRDPDTGDMAKPLTEDDVRVLEGSRRAGRQRRWVVKRDKDGHAVGVDQEPIPRDEIGPG